MKEIDIYSIKKILKKNYIISLNFFKKTVAEIIEYLKKVSVSSMSVKDQTFFIKRLSFLVKAGIPIFESLIMIRNQTRQKSYVVILDTIIKDVSSGQCLSAGLAKFRHVFGDLSINIISFGESTGALGDNLAYLAEELKKKNALRKKILGAFVYPAVVTFAAFGIVGFLMVYLFPKIIPIFKSLHIALPLSTRIVIFVSDFLVHYGAVLIFSLVILTFSFIFALKKNIALRYYFDKAIIKTPTVGDVVKSYNLANATRTMGLLLKSGVVLGEALEITAKVAGNAVYKKEFKKLVKVVNQGDKISAYLAKNRDLFPDVLTQIISVGERTGNLSNSFIYISELYEGEVEEFTKNISTLLEPVMMIVMGIMVGFIAVSIITPIYSITQNLSPK